MAETRYYKVAGHRFSVTGEAEGFANYEPFGCDGGDTLFALRIERGEAPSFSEEFRQEEEGEEIVCGMTADGNSVFEFLRPVGSKRPKVERHCQKEVVGWLVSSEDYREGRLILTGKHEKFAIDNALMVMYALATADKQTALFHAAVVSCGGRGYMFLGSSGTGKSTHARLWLNHIEGSELVNDDNPVVRDGVVYGSPWSGKTPCYRNVSYPLGGIVVLSQAPYNKIRRLKGIEAYIALMSSISGKRWDSKIADGLHETENALAQQIPVWHLECLPDEAAAKLCSDAIKSTL